MKENATKRLKMVLTVLIMISIAVAWGHSAMPVPVSQAESGFFLDFLKPYLRVFMPDDAITDHLIRKIAHFSEYGLMGIEMTAFLAVSDRLKPRFFINTLFSGLTIALIDETIQIISGRGPLISDLWIDLGGFVTGGLLTGIIVYLIRRKKTPDS
ncbi:MAG: VanZ family protein [Lachnospiraceae bacterium]|nr:VanZ family protein [Lachnospiraceae bacterium]